MGIPVISVKGNCDGNTREDKEIVETPYGKILLTHGNWESVDFKYDNLLYMAEEKRLFCSLFRSYPCRLCRGNRRNPPDQSRRPDRTPRRQWRHLCHFAAAPKMIFMQILSATTESSEMMQTAKNRNNGSNNSRSRQQRRKIRRKSKGRFSSQSAQLQRSILEMIAITSLSLRLISVKYVLRCSLLFSNSIFHSLIFSDTRKFPANSFLERNAGNFTR